MVAGDAMQRLKIVGGNRAGTLGSHVFRWDIDNHGIPERFFRLGKAYLESAVAQFGRMMKEPHTSYYDALVGDFLAEHAVELFFKGAILRSNREYGVGPAEATEMSAVSSKSGPEFDLTAAIWAVEMRR